MGVQSKQEETNFIKDCHFNDDFYWELVDEDDDYDGFLHLTSTYDGSGIKIGLKDIIKSLGIIRVIRILFS